MATNRGGPPAAWPAVKNTFTDLTRHGPTTIVTGAVLASPILIGVLFRATLPEGAGTWVNLLFQLISYVTVGLWLTVAVTLATLDYAIGTDPGSGGVLSKSLNLGRIGSYFLASVLFGLIMFGVVLVALIPFLGSVISMLAGVDWNIERLNIFEAGPVVLVTGFLSFAAAIVLATVVVLRIGAYGPASILEKKGPVEALRRSGEITKGHRFDFLVLWLLLAAIGVAVFLVFGGPSFLVAGRRPTSPTALNFMDPYVGMDRVQILINGVSSFLFSALWRPFVVGAVTNFFLELRGRMPSPSLHGMNRGESLTSIERQPDSGEEQ